MRRQLWLRKNDDPKINMKAKKAFESLLMVTARVPEITELSSFMRDIQVIAKEKFGYDYKIEEVSIRFTRFILGFIK